MPNELGFGLHKDGSGKTVVMTEILVGDSGFNFAFPDEVSRERNIMAVALRPGTGTEWADSGEKAVPHLTEKGSSTVETLAQARVWNKERDRKLPSGDYEFYKESNRPESLQTVTEAFNKATGISRAVLAEPQRLTGKVISFVEKDDNHAVLTIKRAGTFVSIPVDSSMREQARKNLGEGVRYEPPTLGGPAKIVNLQQEKGKSQEKGLGA